MMYRRWRAALGDAGTPLLRRLAAAADVFASPGARLQAAAWACYSFFMTLEELQQAIAKLSAEDRDKLRLWLAEFEAGQAEDREPETKASKLGRLAGRAVADFRKRMREP